MTRARPFRAAAVVAMIACLDASGLRRVLLHQSDAPPIPKLFGGGVASVLVEAECLRALDAIGFSVAGA
ncbi:MAG TPA: hypothetical protein VHW65_09400 [Gemmatimonadales bacterium]|jgi:hypothetical protein|nr:hypothetical protein [Gemmatimonadales bacterium]